MKDTAVRISAKDQMRMKATVLDNDRDDALDIVKELLQRAESAQKLGMRSHLDK